MTRLFPAFILIAAPAFADPACDAAARRMLGAVEAIAVERGEPLRAEAERAAAEADLAAALAETPDTCAILLAMPDGAFRAMAETQISGQR